MQTTMAAATPRSIQARTTRYGILCAVAGLALAATPTGTSPATSDGPPGPTRNTPPNCPDSGIKRVESVIKYGGWQKCGTGISVTGPGLSLHAPQNNCPTFVVYEPPHDVPTHKKGFFTVPADVFPIVHIDYDCATSYLFGLIPVGSHCLKNGSKNVKGVQNYLQVACNARFRGPKFGPGEGHGTLPKGR